MYRALIAGVAACLLTTAPVPQAAQAHPTRHYRGGCTFATVNDTLPTEPLGGQPQWTGEATAYVVATTTDTDPSPDINNATPTPTDSISFECTLWRNGSTNLGVILSGSGTGTVSDTQAPFTFTAGEADTIQVCAEVTVAGEQHGDSHTFHPAWCSEATSTPIVPEPIQEALGLAIEVLNDLMLEGRSFTLCAGLVALAQLVNTIEPTIIRIDPADGDTFLFEEVFWECPPGEGSEDLPGSHKVHATCRYRNNMVTGSATAHSHVGALTIRIRCIGKNSDGDIIFDESKTDPGDQATLVETASPPYQLCAVGTADWADGHTGTDPEHCTINRHGVRPPKDSPGTRQG